MEEEVGATEVVLEVALEVVGAAEVDFKKLCVNFPLLTSLCFVRITNLFYHKN